MSFSPDPMIELINVSKQFSVIGDLSYLALRDTLTEILFHPLNWISSKFRRGSGAGTPAFFALNKVSFSVNRGEVLGIIGRNGAGKSTLLKILSRITPPTSGEIRIYGRISSLLEVGTGFHPELTGRENIFLSGAILGMGKKEIETKFDRIVAFSGVADFLEIPVKRYSSGMRVRLAFSVAAFLEPDILLIDEVLSVGDSEFQKKCIQRMKELTTEEGRTIIFVSHDLNVVKNLCTRALLLDRGTVKAAGSVPHVMEAYGALTQTQSHISLKDRHDRRGNGKMRLTSISFRDSHGNPKATLQSGSDVQIWVEYDVIDPTVTSYYFAISIMAAFTDTNLSYLGNKITGETIRPGDPIRIHIKKFPLNVGIYSFAAICVDSDDDVLDWVLGAGEFEVTPGNFYPSEQLPPAVESIVLMDYQFSNSL